MIFDVADIDLLRFVATVKNMPPRLYQSFKACTWEPARVEALCSQNLITENRNHLSYALTTQGGAVLASLGYTAALDSKQPAKAKLDRRLQSAWVSALFYRTGCNVFGNRLQALTQTPAYLPSNALRRDTASPATHVFGGVRYMGIAHHNADALLLAHYVDDQYMYITSEMRMFNAAVAPYEGKPAIVYCGETYESIIKLLTVPGAFQPAKRRGSDAVTYRIAAERTQYPLYLTETSDRGALQLMILSQPGYRRRIAEFALQAGYTAPPDNAAMLDGMMGEVPFLVCVDMDFTRIRAAVKYAKANHMPALAAVALPCQLDALELLGAELYPMELYAMEGSDIAGLFPDIKLYAPVVMPFTREDDRYALVE